MSGPGERRRVVDLYSATPMAAARVAERLGYPTGQCLECRPAKDPGYAGHMAKLCFVKFLWAVSAFLLVRLSGCF